MDEYKRDFIDFMVRADVLTFGDFVTKSGRPTPYFVNTGKYRTGEQMRQLGIFYAEAIAASDIDVDVLFGPAYKGIPLVVSTAVAMSTRGTDVAFCFNRKEVKDHGEGGILVGHEPEDGDRVLIIEDVTTAGTSIRETVPLLLDAAAVEVAGLVVSVDRSERGQGDRSALEEVGAEFGMATFAIVTVHDIVEHLSERDVDGRSVFTDEDLHRVQAHLVTYGARGTSHE